jgi:hypothetical protein
MSDEGIPRNGGKRNGKRGFWTTTSFAGGKKSDQFA